MVVGRRILYVVCDGRAGGGISDACYGGATDAIHRFVGVPICCAITGDERILTSPLIVRTVALLSGAAGRHPPEVDGCYGIVMFSGRYYGCI